MEHRIELVVERESNFVIHMLHMARKYDTDYRKKYIRLHDINAVETLHRHMGWLYLDHNSDQAHADAFHLLVGDACASGDAKAFYEGLLSADQPEHVRGIAQAMLHEYDVFVQQVWPAEERRLKEQAADVRAMLEEKQLEQHAAQLMAMELTPIQMWLTCCDMGGMSGVGLGQNRQTIYCDGTDDTFYMIAWEVVEAQMNTAIDLDIPDRLTARAWMGAALHYHKYLTGKPYWMKHYMREILMCESMAHDTPVTPRELFEKVLARIS